MSRVNIKDGKVYCIVNDCREAWFCAKCRKKSSELYYLNKSRWCDKCVSDEIKNQAIRINQNQELL